MLAWENGLLPDKCESPEVSLAGLSFGLESAAARRSPTGMNTRVSSKGQIVLPAAIRQQDDIKPGQEFEVERIDRGEYRLRRCAPSPNEGLADWLLSCPEKGFFVGVASESTNDL